MGATPRRLRASQKVVRRGVPPGAEGLEPAEDLAVAVAAEQAQGDDEPDQEPARQPGAVGAVVAGSGEDFFHAGAGDDTFQGAESLASGPGREGVGLLADVDHRSLLTSHGVVANSCWSEAFYLATPLDGIGAGKGLAVPSMIGGTTHPIRRRTAMTPQELLLVVFCLIDDELKALDLGRLRQRGPQPTLADSEVITIEIVGEFWGLDADRDLFRHFRRYHAAEFPALARVHRTTFVRQAANLWRVKQLIQRRLAHWLAGDDPRWLVDSLPIDACQFARATFCRRFAGVADYGYDHLRKRHLLRLPAAPADQPRGGDPGLPG